MLKIAKKYLLEVSLEQTPSENTILNFWLTCVESPNVEEVNVRQGTYQNNAVVPEVIDEPSVTPERFINHMLVDMFREFEHIKRQQ